MWSKVGFPDKATVLECGHAPEAPRAAPAVGPGRAVPRPGMLFLWAPSAHITQDNSPTILSVPLSWLTFSIEEIPTWLLHWFMGPQLSSVPGTELGAWLGSVNTKCVLSLEL